MLATGTSFAILYTELVRDVLGVPVRGGFGYSLGESSMLFATGGWRSEGRRDDLISDTPVFHDRLCGPRRTVRELWGLPEDTPDQDVWGSHVLLTDVETVRAALAGYDRVFLTHVNTPRELVIAGDPAQCRSLIEDVGCPAARSPVNAVMHAPVVDAELDGLAGLQRLPDRLRRRPGAVQRLRLPGAARARPRADLAADRAHAAVHHRLPAPGAHRLRRRVPLLHRGRPQRDLLPLGARHPGRRGARGRARGPAGQLRRPVHGPAGRPAGRARTPGRPERAARPGAGRSARPAPGPGGGRRAHPGTGRPRGPRTRLARRTVHSPGRGPGAGPRRTVRRAVRRVGGDLGRISGDRGTCRIRGVSRTRRIRQGRRCPSVPPVPPPARPPGPPGPPRPVRRRARRRPSRPSHPTSGPSRPSRPTSGPCRRSRPSRPPRLFLFPFRWRSQRPCPLTRRSPTPRPSPSTVTRSPTCPGRRRNPPPRPTPRPRPARRTGRGRPRPPAP